MTERPNSANGLAGSLSCDRFEGVESVEEDAASPIRAEHLQSCLQYARPPDIICRVTTSAPARIRRAWQTEIIPGPNGIRTPPVS